MSVHSYKKAGKTFYRVRAYLGNDPKTGEKIYKSKAGFATLRDARAAEALILEGNDKPSDRTKFKNIFDDWLELYQLRVKESSYHITKRRMENHLLPLLGNYYVDAIELRDVQKIVNDWSRKFVRFAEMKRYMSSIFDEAVRQGFIRDNPCRLIVMPNPSKTNGFEEVDEFENYYNKYELKDFLMEIKEYDVEWYTFFRLLAFTGIRRGEALALNWSDLKGNELSITKTLAHGEGNKIIVQSPKTPKSKRVISLDGETITILKAWRRFQISLYGMRQVMFVNNKRGYYSLSKPGNLLSAFFKTRPHLKPITSHGFRHTHCSMLFESGATLSEVQKRLGHTDIKTTMNIYTHVSKEKKEEAVERLVGYLGF